MEITKPYISILILSHLIIFLPHSLADEAKPSHGYNCSSDLSIYPCKSFFFYLAGADSSLLDLSSIGDLFGVSRVMISRSTNLSSSSESLSYGQPLLIPLPCSCISNHSYSPVDYQILAGDTFYVVSSFKFSNLTSYPAVEDANPLLIPTDLTIGVMVTFPLFCQCPRNGSRYIVTYALQPSDSYDSIASRFGSDVQSLTELNGREGSVRWYSTILIPVSRIPSFSMSLSAEPTRRKGHLDGAVVGLSVALGVMGLFCVGLLLQMSRLGKRWWWIKRFDEELGGKGIGRTVEQRAIVDVSEWLDRYKVYQIEELREATANFDDGCLIRGSVYRGEINGEIYAVKKMKWNAEDELRILQKVNHTNLVKLEGFCIDPEPGHCYLVYEFVPNNSLHWWLHDPARPHPLPWRSRLRIALDLAHALQYIHEHTFPRVVHKDVKSSNVLLDTNFRAKIANFGLARTGHNAFTAHIVGTQGYVAPEYVADGLVSTKLDVFAYGEEGLVMAMRSVARACLQREPARRPTMVEVVYALSKVDDASSSADFSVEVVGGREEVVAR